MAISTRSKSLTIAVISLALLQSAFLPLSLPKALILYTPSLILYNILTLLPLSLNTNLSLTAHYYTLPLSIQISQNCKYLPNHAPKTEGRYT
jgi:hypothetical protein